MDKAELEAKKNNLFHLLEYIIKRGNNKYTVQCLVGNIKEFSNIFGDEHWSIEHHGSDNTSILYAAPTKQMAYDGFRELIRNNKAEVIYFVTKVTRQGATTNITAEKEIKIHVDKVKDSTKYIARHKEFGNFTVEVDESVTGQDSFIKAAEAFHQKVSAFEYIAEKSVKSKNSKIGTLTVIRENGLYSGYLSNSDYVPAKAYKTIDDLIKNDVIPGVSKLNDNAEITVEDEK